MAEMSKAYTPEFMAIPIRVKKFSNSQERSPTASTIRFWASR